jgi:hypothetical protein
MAHINTQREKLRVERKESGSKLIMAHINTQRERLRVERKEKP